MSDITTIQVYDMYEKYKDKLSEGSKEFFSKPGSIYTVYQDLDGVVYVCSYLGIKYKDHNDNESLAIDKLFRLVDVLVDSGRAKAWLCKPSMMKLVDGDKLLLVYIHLDEAGVKLVNDYYPGMSMSEGEGPKEYIV